MGTFLLTIYCLYLFFALAMGFLGLHRLNGRTGYVPYSLGTAAFGIVYAMVGAYLWTILPPVMTAFTVFAVIWHLVLVGWQFYVGVQGRTHIGGPMTYLSLIANCVILISTAVIYL